MTYRWIVGDTETTSLKDPRACQIAWVEVDDNLQILNEFSSLIDPERAIEPGASGTHHITNAMVSDAPTMDEFFYTVHDNPLGHGDVVLVAHNAAFDRPMIQPYVGNLVTTLCTLRLARAIYPDMENHKLQTLRYAFELDTGKVDAHSASGDVAVLIKLLERMMTDTGLDMPGLLELGRKPLNITKFTFGKFKGKLIDPTSKEQQGWVSWLLKQDNVDPDLRATLTALF